MKVKNNLFAAFLLTALTVFMACEKNVISIPGDVPEGARVKFIHVCSDCPGLLVTANTKTVNPTAMTYGSATVGAFPLSYYAVLPEGELALDIIRSDSSKSILATKINVVNGKYYSVYIGDTLKTPSISLIEDDVKAFQDTLFRLRFVNMLSGTKKDTLELWHQNAQKVIGANVMYGKASEFTFIPSYASDTLFFRKVGTTVIYPLSTGIITTGGKAQTFTYLAFGLKNKTTGTQIARFSLWRNR